MSFSKPSGRKTGKRSYRKAKDTGNKAGEGRLYFNLGAFYIDHGQYDKALEQYKMELNTARRTGDKAGEGRAYGNLGDYYSAIGQFQKAIEQYEMQLSIAKQIGDRAGEGCAHGSLGICYRELGRFPKSKEHHEMELNISKEVGDKAAKGRAYGNLGNTEHDLGNCDKAIKLHELRLAIAKQIGEKAAEAHAHGNLGTCYGTSGQYEKAIEHIELVLKFGQQIGDKYTEGTADGNLGNCYFALGQYHEAKKQYKRHLSISKLIRDKPGVGRALANLGNCYIHLGQYQKAEKLYKLYLNIVKEIGDKAGEASACGNLGYCYNVLGHCYKAVEHYQLQLNIARRIEHKAGEGTAHGLLGILYMEHRQIDRAKRHLEMSINIAKQIRDKAMEESAHHNLGLCQFISKQYDEAELNLKNSVQDFQDLFRNAPRKDNVKISYLETFSPGLSLLIETLLVQGKYNDALVYAEERRSKALGELLLKQYHFQGAEHAKQDMLGMPKILEIVKEIGSTVLFFTLLHTDVCVWVINPNGDVKYIKATPGSSNLNSLISDARELLELRSPRKCEDRSLSFYYPPEMTDQTKDKPTRTPATPSNPLQALYQLLVAPVQQFIEGSQIVIVPDGPLPLVPFAALIDENEKYLAESFQIRLVPSLATADMIRKFPRVPDGHSTPLIVGDPDVGEVNKLPVSRLPHANEEAQMIGRLLNVQPLTAEKATRKAVLAKLETASIIHIAAHGDAVRGEILLAPSPGMDKGNLTKDDVFLTMSHLEEKHLRAQLVVLSCCYSGRGEVKAEGVIGIARAFLGAGARAVLVAIQKIDDQATLMFMKEFYEDIIRGQKASKALDRAMKAVRNADNCRLSYWAPFVLIGDDVSPLSVS